MLRWPHKGIKPELLQEIIQSVCGFKYQRVNFLFQAKKQPLNPAGKSQIRMDDLRGSMDKAIHARDVLSVRFASTNF